ncbi:MAG: bifunctional methylenetetrahydrofolate dehydrogenase/methenyltetrahydrofolate cyclohydrolase FolD [bacterium]|nr:bifunctional methylenetetrahydrofolate dehydrogenase/methenyltetrahydrofolate cyclohydrolase FolD [bacterium]
MSAKIIDGKAIAAQMQEEMKIEVESLKNKYNLIPGLAVVLIGDNAASRVYVNMKKKACQKLEIYSEEHKLPRETPEQDLLELINKLNANEKVHGILVQLPLPDHIDEDKVLNAIDPSKDVDGFHPVNVGNLVIGKPSFLPCTPYGIQQLLLKSGIQIEGKHVVVVGRSNIVGKPVALILLQKAQGANATVTVCHSRSGDLSYYTKQADILIAAIGRARMIKGDMVKHGAVVIDVGVNRVDDSSSERGYKLVGDVDFEEVKEIASAITPVPGGVGPMTITMLMHNTIKAARMQRSIR